MEKPSDYRKTMDKHSVFILETNILHYTIASVNCLENAHCNDASDCYSLGFQQNYYKDEVLIQITYLALYVDPDRGSLRSRVWRTSIVQSLILGERNVRT